MLFLDLTARNNSCLCKTNTGLGNTLFQLSFQYSICKKYEIKANYCYLYKFLEKIKLYELLDYDKTIFRNFNLNKDTSTIDYSFQETKLDCIYDDVLVQNILNQKNSNILVSNSYMQSLEYFDLYRNEIQLLFSPSNLCLEYIYNKYDVFTKSSVINVSLHLRLEWGPNVKYDKQYYIDSINFIKDKYSNSMKTINFLVFSDNITEAKTMLCTCDVNFIWCINNKDYIDLWIMSLCDHNIICHSTFGWWGAYLNRSKNKMVLYPTELINFYSKLYICSKDICKKKFIPSDWIAIDSTSIIYN